MFFYTFLQDFPNKLMVTINEKQNNLAHLWGLALSVFHLLSVLYVAIINRNILDLKIYLVQMFIMSIDWWRPLH